MTITFVYTIPNFLVIILGILSILSLVFLIYGGLSLKKTRESYMSSNLFIKGGIIGIILFVIRLCFPGYIGYNLTAEESQFLLIIGFLLLIPELIIDIVIFGIFFAFIGFRNKLNYGYYLLGAGVLFLIKMVFFLFNYFAISYIIDMTTLIITNHFSTFFSTSAMLIFLIYSILIKERFLMASAICMIASFLISIFYFL